MIVASLLQAITPSDIAPTEGPAALREHGLTRDELLGGAPAPEHGLFLASVANLNPFSEAARQGVLGAQVATRALLHHLVETGGVRRWYIAESRDETYPADRPVRSVVTDQLVDAPVWQHFGLCEAAELIQHGFIHALISPGPVFAEQLLLRSATQAYTVPVFGFVHTLPAPTAAWLPLGAGPSLPHDALLSPSHAGKRAIEAHLMVLGDALGAPVFAGDVEVIPYGTEEKRLPAKAEARQALGWAQDELVFLSVGRIDRDFKFDPSPLLHAFALFRRRLSSVAPVTPSRLVLAGSADEYDVISLEAEARALGLSDVIELRPDFAPELGAPLLAGADVFIAFSDNTQETHGLAVIDAMRAGLPVIAADWNGYRETVADTGVLIPTAWRMPDTTPDAAASCGIDRHAPGFAVEQVVIDLGRAVAAMLGYATEPERRAADGAAARARAAAHFDAATNARRTLSFITERALAARAAPPKPRHFHLGANWAQVYAHYPTAVIDGTTKLGPGALSVSDWPAHTQRVLGLLARPAVKTLLERAAATLNPGDSVASLATKLAPHAPSLRREGIERWLVKAAKYGLFEVL